MKIKFLRDFLHSDNGYEILLYPAGTEVDVTHECGQAALDAGAGEATDRKDKGAAPKNKARG